MWHSKIDVTPNFGAFLDARLDTEKVLGKQDLNYPCFSCALLHAANFAKTSGVICLWIDLAAATKESYETCQHTS